MFGLKYPQGLLQPWKNLQQFSEELYAMLSEGSGASQSPPPDAVDEKPPERELQLRRTDDSPGPSLRARPLPSDAARQAQIATAEVSEPVRKTYQMPAYDEPRRAAPSSPQAVAQSLLAQARQQVAEMEPDRLPPSEQRKIDWGALRAWAEDEPLPTPLLDVLIKMIPLEGEGQSTYMGMAQDPAGPGACIVQLYSGGPNGPPDTKGPGGEEGGLITVNIFDLNTDEEVPTDMWISGIQQVSHGDPLDPTYEYWAQLPLWVA